MLGLRSAPSPPKTEGEGLKGGGSTVSAPWLPDVSGVEPAPDQRADIAAVLGAELGARRRSGGMMATGLAPQHLSSVDVVGDCRLGRQRASLVDRRIDILALP